MITKIKFPNHRKGDWWSGANITVTPRLGFDPIDMSTCTSILMQVKTDKTSKKSFLEFSLENGKVQVLASNKIYILPQIVDLPAGTYYSDVEVVTQDGKPITIVDITWIIDQDISRKVV